MKFVLNNDKDKSKSSYKSLYISNDLIEEIDRIARENDTSFNRVVVSMVEYALENYSS